MEKVGFLFFWVFFTFTLYFTHMIGKSLFGVLSGYLFQGNLGLSSLQATPSLPRRQVTFTVNGTIGRHTYYLVPRTQYPQLHSSLLYARGSCYI